MAEGIRVEIERNGCISCAACWTACPEFFEENEDDGLSQVKEEYRIEGDRARGEAPESLKESIQEAVDSCPTEVIKI